MHCEGSPSLRRVRRFFFGDGTVWHDALPPRGLRDAAMELLHALVAVEAEALSHAPGIRGRVMAALIEHLLATFVSIATGELASVSQGGVLQVFRVSFATCFACIYRHIALPRAPLALTSPNRTLLQ